MESSMKDKSMKGCGLTQIIPFPVYFIFEAYVGQGGKGREDLRVGFMGYDF